MTHSDYNGWWNYETWVVKLWLDNEQSNSEYWNQATLEAWQTAEETPSAVFRMTGTEPFTTAERAVYQLEKQLQLEHEEALPELEGFVAGLLNAAMSEVNWHEIAQSLVEANEPREEKEAQ